MCLQEHYNVTYQSCAYFSFSKLVDITEVLIFCRRTSAREGPRIPCYFKQRGEREKNEREICGEHHQLLAIPATWKAKWALCSPESCPHLESALRRGYMEISREYT